MLAPVSSFLVSMKDDKTHKFVRNVQVLRLSRKGVRQFYSSTIARKYKGEKHMKEQPKTPT